MFAVEYPAESKLSFKILESIKPESWAQTYSWTEHTRLLIKDPQDKETFESIFGEYGSFTFDDRMIVDQYILWKKAQLTQTPTIMSIDAAYADGSEVQYFDAHAIIRGTEIKKVPACRVPMAEEHLRQLKDARGVRVGSDVLAASLASMTRWTGEATTMCMPLDTMKKYLFRHARPEGIMPFLVHIPGGPQKTGCKGRPWAYHLMSVFQQMPPAKYAKLMSDWCRAMFSLPIPTATSQMPTVFSDNIEKISFEEKLYYRIKYANASVLGMFDNAFGVSEQYEVMAQKLVEFAAARQGDNSGISMLSQSSASWGLVSKNQAELEQTVSLILGMAKEKTVLSGYTQPELERIRASVKFHSDTIVVWEKVEGHDCKDPKNQTSDPSGGLYLIRGRTMLDTTLTAMKLGRVKSYTATVALEKMWAHVERAVSTGDNVVYFSAGLPPLDTKINIFAAGNTWASLFFFSNMVSLRKAKWAALKGIEYADATKYSPREAHTAIIKGMNNTIASWIVPPVNRNVSFSGLLASVKSLRKQTVTYDPESDDFVVNYLAEESEEEDEHAEDADDEANETDDSREENDSDEEDKKSVEIVKKKPKKAAPKVVREAPKSTFVPTVTSTEEV